MKYKLHRSGTCCASARQPFARHDQNRSRVQKRDGEDTAGRQIFVYGHKGLNRPRYQTKDNSQALQTRIMAVATKLNAMGFPSTRPRRSTCPVAGCIGLVHLKQDPLGGTAAFYHRLLKEHRTLVAQGAWFEQSDSFFRLGFGWPGLESMKEGLAAISRALGGKGLKSV